MKNCSDKWFRRLVLICWIIIVVLEVYKQIIFAFDSKTGVWDYAWYAFPFQLCSSPLYVLPFIIFMKEGKVRDAFIAFMSTFSLFGGLVVFIYPNDVFISTIGINLQTMIHHGIQIILGIYFMVYNRKKLSIKYFFSGVIVFIGLVIIAMSLNLIVPNLVPDTFNMFYISPLFQCTLPVLSAFYPPTTPYVVFLLIYILGFILASSAIYFIQYVIIRLCSKRING